MVKVILAAVTLAACSPLPPMRFPAPAAAEDLAAEDDGAETYGAEAICPDGLVSISVRLFQDGEAQVDVAGPSPSPGVRIDATAVAIPDDGVVLTFDGSSEQLGFADGEAVLVIARGPDGSALLSWERWAPACGPS